MDWGTDAPAWTIHPAVWMHCGAALKKITRLCISRKIPLLFFFPLTKPLILTPLPHSSTPPSVCVLPRRTEFIYFFKVLNEPFRWLADILLALRIFRSSRRRAPPPTPPTPPHLLRIHWARLQKWRAFRFASLRFFENLYSISMMKALAIGPL